MKIRTISKLAIYFAFFISINFEIQSQTVSAPISGFFCTNHEAANGDQDLFGVRLRNLSSSGGEKEVFIGSGDLGQNNSPGGDREQTDLIWQASNTIIITLDSNQDTISITINGSQPLTYSSGIIDIVNGLGIEDIDRFCFGIREGAGNVDINNLTVDGFNIGDFAVTSDTHWDVTGICLGSPGIHIISFNMLLSGPLPNNESAKVEFLFGGETDNNCGLPANDRVGIGTSEDIDESAILEVRSTDKGLLPPRMTSSQRDAINNPAKGLIIYNLTLNCLEVNDGTPGTPDWNCISGM